MIEVKLAMGADEADQRKISQLTERSQRLVGLEGDEEGEAPGNGGYRGKDSSIFWFEVRKANL